MACMLLREATPEDAAAVATVHVRSWQVGYRGLLDDGYLESLRPEDRASRYTFGSTDPLSPRTTVAVEESEILGFATIAPADEDGTTTGELCALYVDPDRWRRGIGSVLLADACDRLATSGFDQAVLWVLQGNDRAVGFYRAAGWAPDGTERQDEVWGATVTEDRLRRALP